MKKTVGLLVLLATAYVNGQTKMFSDNLSVATAENKIKVIDFTQLTSHLSYLSKNYDNVFGEYIFSFDSNNFGDKNVYVGQGERMYYQGQSAFIMEHQGPLAAGNLSWRTDYVSGLLSGLKLIFNTQKNYTKSYSDFNK